MQPRIDPVESVLPGADERFMLLLDTLPYIAFVIARGGLARHYNRRFVDYLGFQPGPGYADRTALHHPDDQAALRAAREAGASRDVDYVVEVRLRRADGAYRWHRIHNKPLFRDGVRVAYLGTAIDVHDTRAEQEVLEERVRERTAAAMAGELRYRELYDRTPMALHSSDGRARLVEVNRTWLEMFGYAAADVLGRSPAEFMTADSAAIYRERAWPEMLASAGAAKVMDYQFVTAWGRVFDGRLSARGVFGADGTLMRTWSAIADVTAEKEAARALSLAQRLEAIGQLTAGMAHDFNNLLTAILGGLELAARPGQSEEARLQLMGRARTAAERGGRLVAQLLALSRQQQVAAGVVDVNAAVRGMAAMLADAAGPGVDVDVACAEVPPALGDATQIEMAVMNLVINARDAMDGVGRVEVLTALERRGAPARAEEPEAGEYIAIRVRDSGPGIAAGVRERMFEPFFTTKGAARGSGLGLAQVLGLARQVGGGVAVETAPGRTAITLLLRPATEGAAGGAARGVAVGAAGIAREDAAVGAGAGGVAVAGAGPPRAILLVDDDPDVRITTATMLREAGYAVTDVGSGAAALQVLDGGAAVDLLITDLAMPGMAGAELADRARHLRPGLRVLFVTGYADEALMPPAGAAAVLRKPFRLAGLLARVAGA